MKLSIATAMLDAAHIEAKRLNVAVCISVLDEATWPMAMIRMDGTALGSIEVSTKKARTSVLFQMDSADFAAIGPPGGEAYTLENTNGGLTSFGGGVVLKAADGTLLGAIGVSGASMDEDIAITRAGAAALHA